MRRLGEDVSGGVGANEQDALAQVKPDYNLRLLFAVAVPETGAVTPDFRWSPK